MDHEYNSFVNNLVKQRMQWCFKFQAIKTIGTNGIKILNFSFVEEYS